MVDEYPIVDEDRFEERPEFALVDVIEELVLALSDLELLLFMFYYIF